MKLTIEEAKRMMDKNGGNLNLLGTNYTELPDYLAVSGWLDLSGMPITKLPDGLTVGGWLDLSGTLITKLPDELTVGGCLDLRGTSITKLPDGLTVGGWLDLSGTPITELPDGLTVGGDLDLRGTPITELPDGLTVGGCLDLRGTPITELPDGLTVGGDIFGFSGNTSHVKHMEDGDYVPNRYLYADGIFTHVTRKKIFRNYDYYIGKVPGVNVVSDGTYYAHCNNIREGIRDLEFKHAKDRGAEQYRGIDMDKPLPTAKMIEMYRVITGACRQGTEAFLQSLGKLKDAYTVREAIKLTSGQYGANTFKKFFE